MKNKIKNRFSDLSLTSSLILKHGMQISCLLMFAGLFVSLNNKYSGNYSPSQTTLSHYIIEAAVTVAAEIIIGGLLFDYFFKKNKGEEE